MGLLRRQCPLVCAVLGSQQQAAGGEGPGEGGDVLGFGF